MYGAQTGQKSDQFLAMFENDVEMYGAQTTIPTGVYVVCLRMM